LGLFNAHIEAKEHQAALDVSRRMPAAVRATLDTRADFAATLAFLYYSTDQLAAGDEALRRALDLASRSDSEQALNARLAVANLPITGGQRDRAASLYQQTVAAHPDSVLAWQGLVGAYAEMRAFPRVLAAVRSMPRASRDTASESPDFLNAVALAHT